ncbi:MAG: helix-hairpin-helix domain-containing protein [Anaerolineales bacterium]
MSKLTRAFGYFTVGLGLSLIIGYWLKQEDQRRQDTKSPPSAGGTNGEASAPEERIVLSSRALDAADNASPNPPSPTAPETALETEPTTPTETLPVREEMSDPADDLTTIEGIGPKTASILAELGITHYADLAAADGATLLAQLQGKVRGVSEEKVHAWIEAAQGS